MTTSTVTQKICSKCKVTKERSDFTKNPRLKSGLSSQCRVCQSLSRVDPSKAVETQTCSRCHTNKPSFQFGRCQRRPNGLRTECKECMKTMNAEARKTPHFLAYMEKLKQSEKAIPPTKRCTRCGIERPSARFYPNHLVKDGLTGSCKDCLSELWKTSHYREKVRRDRQKYKINIQKGHKQYIEKLLQTPEGRRTYLSYRLKCKYGITADDYERMLEEQSYVCAICEREPANSTGLFVDHCHATGRIRGLLCAACNLVLGRWEDNPLCAENALAYLLKYA